MDDIKISLFCSAVRPKLWDSYLESLKSTTVSYEVVFSGFNTPEEVNPFLKKYPELKYIHTGKIKPAQNYEISRRLCYGETISWSCDDAEYPDDVLGKAYKYWKSKENDKLILSIQTKESGYGMPKGQLFDMRQHCFFGCCPTTPLMSPMCLMSRQFLQDLGGYDRRYVSGQTENSVVMRAYQHGGKVEIFGGPDCYIDIDHLGKSFAIGESKIMNDFLNRPFAKGYNSDRRVLENSWVRLNHNKLMEIMKLGRSRTDVSPADYYDISSVQLDEFEPFEDKDIFTKSQSNNLPEMWE